jgi:hypothetical protein
MMAWLSQLIPIPRLELILLFVSVLIFGILGGIAWITLAMEIRPIKLSTYFASLFSAVAKYWLNKEHVESHPIGNPENDTKEIKDAFLKSKSRQFRPIHRPNNSRNSRTQKERENTKDKFPK